MRALAVAVALVMGGCAAPARVSDPVVVYAAGSLRDALTEVARDYEARTGQPVAMVFGPSGLLRERIEKGEGAHVFASADTQHPKRLADGGAWVAQTVFARNSLCALVRSGFVVNTDSLLDSMLRVDVRLGMSTPKADPSGDYALALFERAGAIRPGAREALAGKALQLTGGPTSMAAPPGRHLYAWVMEQGSADIFLTYCTNAVAARRDRNSLQVVQVPAALQVGASYGLTYRQGAPAGAAAFAGALREGPAQDILARHGFARP